MWKLNLIVGIFLFLLGFLIIRFKLTYLIAGYNTSSKKEKAKYDKDKLVKSVGNLLIFSSGILIFGSLFSFFLNDSLFISISWFLFTAYIVVMIIHLNISNSVLKKRGNSK